jgi:lipoprotein signal peptidase
MTDCAPSFLVPEKRLRGAPGNDGAVLAARQRSTVRVLAAQRLGVLGLVAGGTAGASRSAQIGQVLRSRHQVVAAAGGRETPRIVLASGRVAAIGLDPLRESGSAPAAVACGKGIAAVTALRVTSGRVTTQRCPRNGVARIVARALRRGIRERWAPLMCLVIVFVDQATKAARPAGTFVVNTGGVAVLPAPLDSMLWKSQTFGAVCDTADTVLLLIGLRVARRLTHRSQRAAATGVLAGLLSNLLDRLGASSLFHVGLPRGCIDWIAIPAWPTARSNIADIVIAAGVLAFTLHPLRHCARALRTLIRRSRFARFAAAGTGLIAIAIWTTFWQANRNTAELHTTTRSETATRCTVTTYPSDGMDWLSYRPKAGPNPYHVDVAVVCTTAVVNPG